MTLFLFKGTICILLMHLFASCSFFCKRGSYTEVVCKVRCYVPWQTWLVKTENKMALKQGEIRECLNGYVLLMT